MRFCVVSARQIEHSCELLQVTLNGFPLKIAYYS